MPTLRSQKQSWIIIVVSKADTTKIEATCEICKISKFLKTPVIKDMVVKVKEFEKTHSECSKLKIN